MRNRDRKSPVRNHLAFVASFVGDFVDKARDKVLDRAYALWGSALAVILLNAVCLGRDRRSEPVSTSLVRTQDIAILDEENLQAGLKGWTVPADYFKACNNSVSYGGGSGIPGAIRSGSFGLLSDERFYTTWREIAPLSDEAYAEGKTTIFDGHVSELVTPPFELKLDYITFLLSGGNMPDKACVNLLTDGKVVRSATGRNHDMLEWVAFEVKELRGKEARIQVLDTSTAALGYITVDCVCQSPDPKGALRILSLPPSASTKTAGRVQTLSGQFNGTPEIAEGRLRIAGQALDLKDLMQWDAGSGSQNTGKRVLLVNGDSLAAEVLGLEEKKLVIRHAVFGEMKLPVSDIAQALFQPGPAVDAAPGTLIHSNGNKIPGELMWIRDDNVSIKCALGAVPLPRARVRAFVFSKAQPAAKAADTVVLADGSTLAGALSLDKETLLLAHESLGSLKLSVADIARVTRSIPWVTPLVGLKGEVREQAGPIPPPVPLKVQSESGDALRMFPRTAMRFTLPKGKQHRRFRANLVPVANNRTDMTALVGAGSNSKTLAVPPDSAGVGMDFDLGFADEIEIVTDCAGTISYPCGIEWRNAFIVEDQTP